MRGRKMVANFRKTFIPKEKRINLYVQMIRATEKSVAFFGCYSVRRTIEYSIGTLN